MEVKKNEGLAAGLELLHSSSSEIERNGSHFFRCEDENERSPEEKDVVLLEWLNGAGMVR